MSLKTFNISDHTTQKPLPQKKCEVPLLNRDEDRCTCSHGAQSDVSRPPLPTAYTKANTSPLGSVFVVISKTHPSFSFLYSFYLFLFRKTEFHSKPLEINRKRILIKVPKFDPWAWNARIAPYSVCQRE